MQPHRSRIDSCIADLQPKCKLKMLPGFMFAFSKFYIFLVFAHIILYCKHLQKMINFSNSLIVNKVLALSKTGCYDNTTLVGSNGIVASSSFVLASVFSVVRDILETHVHVH